MTFWDRFVLWVYLGMKDTLPVGRDAAARIFNLAFERGRLVPNALNDLSILLLLACCPSESPAWTAAHAEAVRRSLPTRPNVVAQALRRIQPPPLTDLLEVGRPKAAVLRSLVFRALIEAPEAEVFANLCQFLGRMTLADPLSKRPQAVKLLTQAIPLYYGIPLGLVDFPSRLYRHVLRSLRLDSAAFVSAFPPGERPPWFKELAQEERDFITRCLAWLSEPELMLLALQCDAHLTLEQIAYVWQDTGQMWSPAQVAAALQRCWDTVL